MADERKLALELELRALVESSDPEWIRTLDDDDEPPVFLETDRVRAVLERLQPEERAPLLLKIALEHLSAIVDLVVSLDQPASRRYFACVTLTEFDDVAEGELLAPHMCISVDPLDGQREGLRPFSTARSVDALAVQGWLRSLGAAVDERFMVGELWPPSPVDYRRVYVGLRRSPCPALRSVGDSMRDDGRTRP